jgi:hypothetical protein
MDTSPGPPAADHRLGLVLVQAGIQERRLHAELAQGVNLVLHQGDQGRHHQHPGRQQQGGQLVTQALAAARGHQHQPPPPAGYRFVVAGLLLLVMALLTQRQILGLSLRQVRQITTLGVTQTALQYVFFLHRFSLYHRGQRLDHECHWYFFQRVAGTFHL